MRRRSQQASKSKIVHKSKSGYVEIRSIRPKTEPKEIPTKEESSDQDQEERSRSRDGSRGRKRVSKPKKMSARPEKPPIVKKVRSDYYPLSSKQLDMKGRWMANEDLNIWMYVSQYGSSGHKKQQFWQQGYQNNYWRKTKTVSGLRNRHRFYVKHLTEVDITSIIQNIKTRKTYYINFEYIDPTHKLTGARRMVSILTDPSIQLPEKTARVPKVEPPSFEPKAEYFEKPPQQKKSKEITKKIEIEPKIEVEEEQYNNPFGQNNQERLPILPFEDRWRPIQRKINFKISKAYFEQWSKWESDQRLWINLEQKIEKDDEEFWKMPSERLRIQTNFLGDRTIQRQQKSGEEEDEKTHEKFLQGLQKDFNIPTKQLKMLFKSLTFTRSDLIEYLESQGKKYQLLWQEEEDDILKKHFRNPNHHLMKLITRLKGPERIERRLKFLKVM